jgi:drug/metabolite transporter (DMT)-like permease
MKSATAPIDRIARMEDSAPDLHADRGRKPAFAALALLALIWGYNWVAMKVALSYAPPATFGALRAGSAAAFLFLALLYSVLFGTGIAWILWLFVLSRLSASISGLAALMIPVVGILADWAQLGVRPGLWETLGAGC